MLIKSAVAPANPPLPFPLPLKVVTPRLKLDKDCDVDLRRIEPFDEFRVEQ